jgi:LuxR family transcriptional regulator, maltose regulon positive regulatory protein
MPPRRDALERIGAELGTPYVRGRTRLVAGQVATARGDQEHARRACEDAVDLLVDAGAAHETALARLELARALAALGRDEAAAAETRSARDALVALGAERDVARVDAAMSGDEQLGDAGRRSVGELTSREVEVLRLVAQGLSDAEIAERLVLSQHTVHRHVANVRAKLRLPSRAAAVAYASQAGLL